MGNLHKKRNGKMQKSYILYMKKDCNREQKRL